MWWVIVPILIGAGSTVLYQTLSSEAVEPKPAVRVRKKAPPDPVRQNFRRLESLLAFESGPTVAVLGQPGAGKSSLVRLVTFGRCEPLPVIGQRTDATDWRHDSPCFFHRWQGLRITDTPGYDTAGHPFESYLDAFPFRRFDKLILVVGGKLHQADERLLAELRSLFGVTLPKRLVLVRSFAETLTPEEQSEVQADLRERLDLDRFGVSLLLVSNRDGSGLDELRAALAFPTSPEGLRRIVLPSRLA